MLGALREKHSTQKKEEKKTKRESAQRIRNTQKRRNKHLISLSVFFYNICRMYIHDQFSRLSCGCFRFRRFLFCFIQKNNNINLPMN